MGFGDAAVYAVGPTEIIRVDDKIFHVGSFPGVQGACTKGQLRIGYPLKQVPLTHLLHNFSMAFYKKSWGQNVGKG